MHRQGNDRGVRSYTSRQICGLFRCCLAVGSAGEAIARPPHAHFELLALLHPTCTHKNSANAGTSSPPSDPQLQLHPLPGTWRPRGGLRAAMSLFANAHWRPRHPMLLLNNFRSQDDVHGTIAGDPLRGVTNAVMLEEPLHSIQLTVCSRIFKSGA
jgi:hypothetical protein